MGAKLGNPTEETIESLDIKIQKVQEKLEYYTQECKRLLKDRYELDAKRHNAVMTWPDGSEFDYTP
jgi:hypothetical protein